MRALTSVSITASVALVVIFSSAAAFGESRMRCLGFYGVPNDPTGKFNYSAVDHCWGGAHVTLAGFWPYPDPGPESGPVPGLTYPDALKLTASLKVEGVPLCKTGQSPTWHMNKKSGGNAYWNNHGKLSPTPSVQELHLNLGQRGGPSTTWTNIATALHSAGVQNKKPAPSEQLPLHVTFDQCSCYANGTCKPDDVLNAWGSKGKQADDRIDWVVIPVTLNIQDVETCHVPKFTRTICKNHDGNKIECNMPLNVTWHWDHAMEVKGCREALSGSAGAEDASSRCEAAMDRAAGDYSQCLLRADASYARHENLSKLENRQARCETRFDRRTTRAINRHGADACASADLVSAMADRTVSYAQDAAMEAGGDPAPSFLFVQNASGGTLSESTLTLTGVSAQTGYFSDRPYRYAGQVTTEEFLSLWDEGENSFADDPPNADFTCEVAGEVVNYVVELTSPSTAGGDLSYTVNAVGDTVLPQALQCESDSHLFIDELSSCDTPTTDPGTGDACVCGFPCPGS